MSADLQNILMLPVLPGSKTAIFCSRGVVFHQTFAPVGGKQNSKPSAVVWNEAMSGRLGSDVTSVFIKFLREP